MSYSKTFTHNGKSIRVEKDKSCLRIFYNGVKVGETQKTSSDMNVQVFKVIEDSELITYDVAVMTSSGTADGALTYCFIGREGQLIYSDAPGFSG